ncbi:MAG: hypothetical protein R3F59_25040 [Myxococcota bacterium]
MIGIGGLVWLTGTAVAADWSAFAAAFPLEPCQDGWMACRVGAQPLDPGLAADARGLPVQAAARLGWFDLQPTAAFSPFEGLSDYPAPAPRPADAVAAGSHAGSKAARRAPSRTPGDAPGADVPGAASDCAADPEQARRGALTAELRACLDARVEAGGDGVRRASQLLLADASARGDEAAWTPLAERHLRDVDPSDADVGFAFSVRLARDGRAAEAYRWAGVTLDHRYRWLGETYDARVYSLYKVRAGSAEALWEAAGRGSEAPARAPGPRRASGARSPARRRRRRPPSSSASWPAATRRDQASAPRAAHLAGSRTRASAFSDVLSEQASRMPADRGCGEAGPTIERCIRRSACCRVTHVPGWLVESPSSPRRSSGQRAPGSSASRRAAPRPSRAAAAPRPRTSRCAAARSSTRALLRSAPSA